MHMIILGKFKKDIEPPRGPRVAVYELPDGHGPPV